MKSKTWFWAKVVFGILEAMFAIVGLVFICVFIGMEFGIFNVQGSISARNAFFTTATSTVAEASSTPPCVAAGTKVCAWDATPEWAVISAGLTKDQPVIEQVAQATDVPARMITSVVVPEQTRFFTSERDVFKRYFEPLKILGSLSQFSLGVSGIKQQTADNIEMYAASTTSPFYPGPGYAELLAYQPGQDHDTVLYSRLTDPNNHYYSYLYTAIYIKEVEAQWQASGYNIANNPGVIATLFNIGYQNSHPNATPAEGGAPITTGGQTYTYGQLGDLYYNSEELANVFVK